MEIQNSLPRQAWFLALATFWALASSSQVLYFNKAYLSRRWVTHYSCEDSQGMDRYTLYSSLPNLWYIKNMYCRIDCTIANKKYTPSVTPEAWKSKNFKCIGPQRHFRGDFHQMKWLKRDLCCDFPQCVGEVHRVSTLQLLEQKHQRQNNRLFVNHW